MKCKLYGSVLFVVLLSACSTETPVGPTPDLLDHSSIISSETSPPLIETEATLAGGPFPGWNSLTGRVWQSAEAVHRAAQRFVRDHDGQVPYRVGYEDHEEETLIDYLPGGRLMKNHWSGFRNIPREEYCGTLGDVCYIVLVHEGRPAGYIIEALGTDVNDVMSIVYDPYQPKGREIVRSHGGGQRFGER